MKRARFFITVAVWFVLTGSVAYAHPGHGSVSSDGDGHSLIHYFTEPFHAVGILGTIAVISVGVASYTRHRAVSRS